MANESNTNNAAKTVEKKPKRNRIKETFAELKKVTWPTFNKVVKQTGAVFVVTIFFLAILMLMDYLLGLANKQLVEGLGDTTSSVLVNPELFVQSVKSLFSTSALPLLL